MLFSSFPDYKKEKISFFFFFTKFIFLNLTVILSILTAFLCLIRVEASHEAYMNNLGNTFMTTIACSLSLTHMNLGTYQWPLIAGWGSSCILAWTTDEKKYFGYMISSARYVSLSGQMNTPTYTHACMHARTHRYIPFPTRLSKVTDMHDHVRKIEIARYCRHEGIPWFIYLSLMTSYDPDEA